MAEVDFVVCKRKINYEGLFNCKELYKLMDEFFSHRGYDKSEGKHAESVNPEGKYIEMEIRYYRKMSEYVQNVVDIKLIMSDLKEVEVKKDKSKIKLNKGKVQLILDGYLETDWQGTWEKKPVYYVIRTLASKYIFGPVTGKYKAELGDTVSQFCNEISSFLNLYRY